MKAAARSRSAVQKIEVGVNIVLVILAVVLLSVLVKRFYWTGSDQSSRSAQVIDVGTKVNLADIDWAKNNKTLLLVLSTTCHFCTENAPFYRQLVENFNGRSDFKLIALLPQSVKTARQYMESLDLRIGDVRQVKLSSLGVEITPTVLLINNGGVVSNIWVGKLGVSMQSAIFKKLGTKNGDSHEGINFIDVSDLKAAL